MKTSLVVGSLLFLASSVYAQREAVPEGFFTGDTLRIGSVAAPRGSTVDVPVYLNDAPGTPLGEENAADQQIQGIAFKASGSFDSIDFIRGGVLSGTPLFERVIPSAGAVGYIALFGNPSLNFTQSADDLIGYLRVTIPETATVGSTIALQIDPSTATVSNQTGTTGEWNSNYLQIIDTTLTVEKAATTTTLTSSKNPSGSSESVTFTATVTSDVGPVDGNIYFYDGATFLGGGPTTAGQRSHTVLSLNPGAHEIKAQYLGNADFAESYSDILVQNVQFGPPHYFGAGATSSTTVFVAWSDVAGADHYDIYQKSAGVPWTKLKSVTTTVDEHAVAAEKIYLYRVVAVDSTGLETAPSMVDPASTKTITDFVEAGKVIKSLHIDELRQAVTEIRTAVGGMGSVTYGDASAGQLVRASHIQELRDALAAARSSGGMAPLVITDDPLTTGTTIKAQHLDELWGGMR
jgi:hypothetical protein